ncbi:MAG: sulfatase-like hydrolase/transferase, partial [Candidatus Omnitrophica bacterium]|nr:sulfatase-like hydrolase/transferase [Candidatus Omnitrophota bacterium]
AVLNSLILSPFILIAALSDCILGSSDKFRKIRLLTLHYLLVLTAILPASSLFRSDALPKMILAWIAAGLIAYILLKQISLPLCGRLSQNFGTVSSLFYSLAFCLFLFRIADRICYSYTEFYLSGIQPFMRSFLWLMIFGASVWVLHAFSPYYRKISDKLCAGYGLKISAGLASVLLLACAVHWRHEIGKIKTELALLQTASDSYSVAGRPESLPDIFLIGIDGVYAEHLSAYGYFRQTSPNIDRFSEKASVYLNVYPNTASTSGSLASVLTGKKPETTGFYMRPEILRGKDSVEHLPGLLRKLGYNNYQITDRYWSDSRDINMLGAFVYANGRKIIQPSAWAEKVYRASGFAGFLVSDTFESSFGLLRNAALMKEKFDPYQQVADTGGHPNMEIGEGNLAALMKTLETGKKPVFIHAHFLDTHGPWFYVKSGRFTSGGIQEERYEINFYDSSIYDFDFKFGLFMQELKKLNRFDESLIILFSDHGLNHDTQKPVPLIIKMPNQTKSRRFDGRFELIDIAPSILKTLGVSKPEWMDGKILPGGSNI